MPRLYNILVMIALFYTMFTGLFFKGNGDFDRIEYKHYRHNYLLYCEYF